MKSLDASHTPWLDHLKGADHHVCAYQIYAHLGIQFESWRSIPRRAEVEKFQEVLIGTMQTAQGFAELASLPQGALYRGNHLVIRSMIIRGL